MAAKGIKTVIDLREIGEHSQADEQKIVTDLGMRYVSIPMHGLSEPKENLVAAWRDLQRSRPRSRVRSLQARSRSHRNGGRHLSDIA